MTKQTTSISTITWQNEKRKLKDLVPWERNPRTLTDKQAEDLKKSISRFGYVETIAINKNTNVIIGGHQRRNLLMHDGKGEEEIDVRVSDRELSESEIEELNLRLNKNTGEWNWDELANFDQELLKEVGFSKEEMDKHFLNWNSDIAGAEKTNETSSGILSVIKIICPQEKKAEIKQAVSQALSAYADVRVE